ncbi:MAG: biopolymer transporter ExbD [Gammaproteobacteria bacterium]|nr:MAG: biopolymer transporter ExbD [Gammaproteobacteria bacterium]
MAYKRNKEARRNTSVELNITAFMNLMVVLVPFLLMTAVFTNISILDLKLPSPDSATTSDNNKKEFEINVIVRKDALTITDQNGGIIKNIPRASTGHNFVLMNQTLRLIKNKFPEKTNITLLSEKFTPYDDIIQIMDQSREFHTLEDGEVVAYELFPDISIGDAPEMAGK